MKKKKIKLFSTKLTSFSSPAFSRPHHSVNDLGEAIVALVDGLAEVPAPGDFTAEYVESLHFAFSFDLNQAPLFDHVTALLQNLYSQTHSESWLW